MIRALERALYKTDRPIVGTPGRQPVQEVDDGIAEAARVVVGRKVDLEMEVAPERSRAKLGVTGDARSCGSNAEHAEGDGYQQCAFQRGQRSVRAMKLRRPRSKVAVATVALVAFLGVGLAGARAYVDNFLAYRGFDAPRDPVYVKTSGTLRRIMVRSPALGGRAQEVYVYLPPGYAAHPSRRYPVLYLLHGFPGRPLAFIETVQMGVVEDSLAAKRVAQPLILVMPFGSTSTFTDEEWANGAHAGNEWASFVARDLVRYIDGHYRTIRAARARAIGGLSEGGYGAVDIALQNPHEFSVVESWSGYMQPAKLRSIYGQRLQLLQANDPMLLAPRDTAALQALGTYFWFYSGSEDHFRTQNAAFASELRRLQIPHRFRLVYGGHNWAIWRANARAAYLVASTRLSDG